MVEPRTSLPHSRGATGRVVSAACAPCVRRGGGSFRAGRPDQPDDRQERRPRPPKMPSTTSGSPAGWNTSSTDQTSAGNAIPTITRSHSALLLTRLAPKPTMAITQQHQTGPVQRVVQAGTAGSPPGRAPTGRASRGPPPLRTPGPRCADSCTFHTSLIAQDDRSVCHRLPAARHGPAQSRHERDTYRSGHGCEQRDRRGDRPRARGRGLQGGLRGPPGRPDRGARQGDRRGGRRLRRHRRRSRSAGSPTRSAARCTSW